MKKQFWLVALLTMLGGFGFTAEEGYKHSGETDQPKDEGSSNDVDDF